MATATADSYAAESGATMYAGRSSGIPAWLEGVPVNKLIEIPNTRLAGSAGAPGEDYTDPFCLSNKSIRAYSGVAFRHDLSELWLAAVGGHADSSDNSVRSIVIAADAPAWQMRHVQSAEENKVMDAPYYLDGLPSSRHVYWSAHWCEPRNRIMLHGSRYCWGATTFVDSNGFNPDTNAWDAAGTWSDAAATAMCVERVSGNVWAATQQGHLYKWTASTDTWALAATFDSSFPCYPPMAYDSLRDQLFTLAFGDGEATGSAVSCYRITANGTTRTAITIASSAAYTAWQAAAGAYASMEYDEDNDRFIWYAAMNSGDSFYVITPNSGTTWDMSTISLASGSVTPTAIGNSGLMSKLRYVPNLKGFMLMTNSTGNLYFLPTAQL